MSVTTSEGKKIKIGLALSGGGYRAAAFHLGVFKKLKALEILDNVDVISTISGGSIAGAYYALNKDDFNLFETEFKKCLQKSVLRKIIWSFGFWLPILFLLTVISLTIWDPFTLNFPNWVTILIVVTFLLGAILFQFKIISFTSLKIKAYKKVFFKENKISNLPNCPVLAINATNLSTGTLWTFSKKKASDSSYEYPKDKGNPIKFNCSEMPLAQAVASSTSVPIPFNPVLVEEKYFENKADYKRVSPKLIDGGLYDNQGVHKITQKNSSYACDIIIVSDGSQPFDNEFKAWNSGFILYRGIDVMMRKIKNLQFIRDVYSIDKEIAYFSLDWRYNLCLIEFVNAIRNNYVSQTVLNYHEIDSEMINKKSNEEMVEHISKKINFPKIIENGLTNTEIQIISGISTNLTALKINEIDLLSRHGEVLTELQITLYCPSLKFKNKNI